MNLRHLRILNTLRSTQSMVKTAEQHGLKTSAVSQALSKLETDLDVVLIDRRTRPIKLTKAGLMTSLAAEQVLHLLNQLSNDLADIENVATGQLRLGIIDGLEASILPPIVKALVEKWPHRQILTRTDRTDHLLASLHDGQIDIAICGNGDDYEAGLESQEFVSEPLIAIVPKRLNEAALKNGEGLDLAKLPMIQYNTDFPLGRAIEAQLRRCRFTASTSSFVDSTHSLISLVDQLGGWAVTTPLSVLDYPAYLGKLDIVPTPFPLITRALAIWTRSGELASSAKLIREHGHAAMRDLITHYAEALPLDADHIFPTFQPNRDSN